MYRTRDRCKRAAPTEFRAHHIPQTSALHINQEFKTLLENKIKTRYNGHNASAYDANKNSSLRGT